QIWDLTVERQLARDLVLSVGYVGSQSYHTNLTMDSNTSPMEVCQNPQGCRSGGVLSLSQLGGQAPIVPQGTTYLPSRPPVVVNGVNLVQLPNPYVSYTQAWFGWGTASYHAMNVSVLKRAARGLTFKANYSWGWQWNAIFNAQSGFPFTPLIGFNNTGSGDGATVDIPNLNPNFKGKVISGTVDRWFDPRAFTVPAAGTYGNAGRSSFIGPG